MHLISPGAGTVLFISLLTASVYPDVLLGKQKSKAEVAFVPKINPKIKGFVRLEAVERNVM